MYQLTDEEQYLVINALELTSVVLLAGIIPDPVLRIHDLGPQHLSPLQTLAFKMVEERDARTEALNHAALNVTPEGGTDNPGEG